MEENNPVVVHGKQLKVGGRDFVLDLLVFHGGLNWVVAIELKLGRFEPEYLQVSFYLEALGFLQSRLWAPCLHNSPVQVLPIVRSKYFPYS